MLYMQGKGLMIGGRDLWFAEEYIDFNLDGALQSSRLWTKQAYYAR